MEGYQHTKKPQRVHPGALPLMLGLPGTVGGSCEYNCPHRQCQKIRKEAQTKCYYCRNEIGYGSAYYRIELGKGRFYKNGSPPIRRFHKSCHLDFARQYAEMQRLLNRYKDGKESGLERVRERIYHKRPPGKLDWGKVQEIRQKYATGNYSEQELADEYRVHQTNIHHVVTMQSWKEPEREDEHVEI
jgi:hypothetical protein